MEPTIYKPGAYKSPGIYKGAGGIYNGRGVYNDGSGGVIPPEHLILCEYFNKRVGANLSSGTINNYGFDSQCPLNIAGGAPYSKNNDFTSLSYSGLSSVIQSKTFTIEFFLKVETLGSVDNDSPTAIIFNSGDIWILGICPNSNDYTKFGSWLNDSRSTWSIVNTNNWHHYEICVNNGFASFFVDGARFTSGTANNLETSWFGIIQERANRCIYRIAQVALWDISKHDSNFVVDYEPIAY